MKGFSFRKLVSLVFALVGVIAAVVFEQAIGAFAAKQGIDQIFVSAWASVTALGWSGAVAFGFFTLLGATTALWIEYWFRDKRDAAARLDQTATACVAHFSFSRSASGELSVALDSAKSDNVEYWAWYVNNGGTMRTAAVLLFVEFSKTVMLPEIFAHSHAQDDEWRQFTSTDRFMMVDLKGWPASDVIVQAIDSRALGLDRRSEEMIWRKYGPMSAPNPGAP